MAIPDGMRKCVVFLGYELPNKQMQIGGSAFWVIRQVAGTNFAYLVTARHCIEKIINSGCDTVQLRVNFKDGLAAPVATRTMDWKFHQDYAVDVAVLQRELPADFDHLGWLSSWFYNVSGGPQFFLNEPKLGIGDDIFVIGLFSQRSGEAKNVPIVRMGNLAAMPDDSEPIKTDRGPMVAYLVETHSMGGLSGSPVFADLFGSRQDRDSVGHPAFYLIGLIHGHFPSDRLETDTVKKENDKLNTGIAVVVPCDRITETIDYHFKCDEVAVTKAQKKISATPDVQSNIAIEPFTGIS
jgi:hypothetical protein